MKKSDFIVIRCDSEMKRYFDILSQKYYIKRSHFIATHKVILKLKKANESYKHQILECEKQKRMLKMLKEHNKKLLEKQTYIHSRRQYDIKQFKT